VNLNVLTLMLLTRELVPGMVDRGRGAVVNVASVAGFVPGPMMAAYHASKSFVVSLSMSLRHELLDTGVSVTCVCPGPVDTNFNAAAGHAATTRLQRLTELTPARVARETYRAMERRTAVHVPSAPAKLTVQLARHAPMRAATAVTARALRGVLAE
jgi:short-subunit dehydrogenase